MGAIWVRPGMMTVRRHAEVVRRPRKTPGKKLKWQLTVAHGGLKQAARLTPDACWGAEAPISRLARGAASAVAGEENSRAGQTRRVSVPVAGVEIQIID